MSALIAALPTPFNGDFSVDYGAFRDVIRYAIAQGCDGLMIGGTTGEFPSLSLDERLRLAEVAVEHAAGKRLFHNISSCCVSDCLELAAGEMSRQWTPILMPPWFYRDAEKSGVQEFLLTVGRRLERGFFLYNFPKMNGFKITPTVVADLAAQAPLLGIKDSGGDYLHTKSLADVDNTLDVFAGSERYAASVARDGLAGIVTGAGLPAAPLLKKILSGLPQDLQDVYVASTGDWSHSMKLAAVDPILSVKMALSREVPGFAARCRPPLTGRVDEALVDQALERLRERRATRSADAGV